jgi:hypothetical protein
MSNAIIKLSTLATAVAMSATLASSALAGGGQAQVSHSAKAHAASIAAKRHHVRHHAHGIPQHNGGDRDADNNGGPNDGDGNL